MASAAPGRAIAAPARRALTALAALAAVGIGFGWLTHRPVPEPALRGSLESTARSHKEAAESQNAYPTTHAEALAKIDAFLDTDLKRVGPMGGGWLGYATIAGDYLERARLTGSFDDYAKAAEAFRTSFAVGQGFGQHLEHAAYNLAIHRLDAVEPDLQRIEHYAMKPDDGTRAAILGIRGDLALYRGDYRRALDLYRQSRLLSPSMAVAQRFANYWQAMGDPERALRYLGEAEYFVTGANQQVLAGLELQRGTIAFGRGDWRKAEAHFARADDIFPGHWTIEEHLGLIAALRGDRARAKALFQRVADRDGSPEAMDALAGLARADGDFATSQSWSQRADTEWRRRMKLVPEAAYGHVIEHLLAFGTPAETLRVAEANYRLRPFGDSATQLASAYLVGHRAPDALRVIEPVLASGWVSSDMHVVAMEAYALAGQGEKADAERRNALAINPHALDRNPAMVWLGH